MKQSKHTGLSRLVSLTFILALLLSLSVPALAAGEPLQMSTTYPGVTAKAGDTLSYSLDLVNNTDSGYTVALDIVSMPDGWTGYFEGSNKEISHVYAKSGSNSSAASFELTIPNEAADGVYTVELQASSDDYVSNLVLTLDVSAEELGNSALSTQYAEQEGSSGTSFTFSSTIQNNTPNEQSYSFSSSLPTGWTITFKPSGESTQVAAITVAARSSQAMDITVTPPSDVAADTYTIPISAISASETLESELTVVITGTYSLGLSTPSGRLSFDATANKQTAVSLTISNYGNVDLQNVNLSSSAPDGWTVEFSQSSIDVLEAGASQEVTAYVTPSEDAMSGDYALSLSVKNSQASDSTEFRVTVKTETTWGVIGVLLIAVAAAGLWFVFRKYGRR